jgi:hypothetical protein
MFATFLVVLCKIKKITSKEIEKKCTIETIEDDDDSTYFEVQVFFIRKDEILVVFSTVRRFYLDDIFLLDGIYCSS